MTQEVRKRSVPYKDALHLVDGADGEAPDTFRISGQDYSPRYDQGGRVIPDHGFIIFRFNYSSLDLFASGGWSHGTDPALKYLASREARGTVKGILRSENDAVIVVEGRVFSLRNGDPRKVAVASL